MSDEAVRKFGAVWPEFFCTTTASLVLQKISIFTINLDRKINQWKSPGTGSSCFLKLRPTLAAGYAMKSKASMNVCPCRWWCAAAVAVAAVAAADSERQGSTPSTDSSAQVPGLRWMNVRNVLVYAESVESQTVSHLQCQLSSQAYVGYTTLLIFNPRWNRCSAVHGK